LIALYPIAHLVCALCRALFAIEPKSFAVDLSKGLALLRIGHDNEMPPLAISPGGRLYREFEAFQDDLFFNWARKIQTFAHRSCRSKQSIWCKIKQWHGYLLL
jgi:hypothetical protein